MRTVARIICGTIPSMRAGVREPQATIRIALRHGVASHLLGRFPISYFPLPFHTAIPSLVATATWPSPARRSVFPQLPPTAETIASPPPVYCIAQQVVAPLVNALIWFPRSPRATSRLSQKPESRLNNPPVYRISPVQSSAQ